jgi:WD40 repeat protein
VTGAIALWAVSSGRVIARTTSSEAVVDMAFAGDERDTLVILAHDGSLELRAADSGSLLESRRVECEDPQRLAVAPLEPKVVAIGCDDGAIQVWDVSTSVIADRWSVQPEVSVGMPFFTTAPVMRLAMGAFGTVVASGFRTGTVRVPPWRSAETARCWPPARPVSPTCGTSTGFATSRPSTPRARSSRSPFQGTTPFWLSVCTMRSGFTRSAPALSSRRLAGGSRGI